MPKIAKSLNKEFLIPKIISKIKDIPRYQCPTEDSVSTSFGGELAEIAAETETTFESFRLFVSTRNTRRLVQKVSISAETKTSRNSVFVVNLIFQINI